MELYLTPNGRIDQPTYWKAVLVLFGISCAVTILSAYVAPLVGFLGILFIWPWIAVHVKRFHDAGKTGWLTVAMVVLAIVVSLVLSAILPGLFGVDQLALQQEMQEDIERAASGDPASAIGAAMEASKKVAQAQLLPSLISTGIVTGVVGAVMGLFKTDPNDNQYGAGPAGASSPDAFV